MNSQLLVEDQRIREAAFAHVSRLNATKDHLTSADLAQGFDFEGQRIPLVNPQRGIFKPKQLKNLLSIRTVFPRPGAKVWYDDQRLVHRQIFESNDLIEYAFMGQDPNAADNQWLREAMELRVPIIYFIGIAPQLFTAVVPAFIGGWDARSLKAMVGFGDPSRSMGTILDDSTAARRYALRAVQQRLHQASFREAVMLAYAGRCALSGLPEPLLLDAAHIIRDSDEQLGQPIVRNGITLSKIHHAAFDAHLIGIDPDFRIHVSDRLLSQNDGPILQALKALDGGHLRLPTRLVDRPDRERLAMRFDQFRR